MQTKEYQHTWYMANKEKKKEQARLKYQTQKEREQNDPEYHAVQKMKRQANSRKWRLNHPEENRTARLETYRKHGHKYCERQKQRHAKGKNFKHAIKLHYRCMNPECKWEGDIPACCLDFHHLENKTIRIGHGSNHKISALVPEINKCTVLCAMCHRMVTYNLLDDSKFKKCNLDDKGNIIN